MAIKIKAKLDKFNRLTPQAIPCDVKTRKTLKKGNIVEISDKVADTLLKLNIVEKVTNKKKTKKGDK
jgi:hypothetical protein